MLLPAFVRAAPLSIENGLVRVEYDPGEQGFCFYDLQRGGKQFAKWGGRDAPRSSNVRVVPMIQGPPGVTSPGQAIEMAGDAEGNQLDVMVFPGCPFVLARETYQNRNQSGDINLLEMWDFQFTAMLDAPVSKWVVRGTGGLARAVEYDDHSWHRWFEETWGKITRKPFRPPGASYRWLAVAEPSTRSGLVTGWLTEDRATTLVEPFYDSSHDTLTIDSFTQWSGFQAKAGVPIDVGTFAIGYFDDVRLGLEQYAALVAKANHVKLPPQPAGYCTWYSEIHDYASDEKSLAQLADVAKKQLKPYGMDFIQIDDGWQLGKDLGDIIPRKDFTAADPKGPYPSGMKAAADFLKADGFTPGLWFMPFSGLATDDCFAGKQDLFLKDKSGQMLYSHWGGNYLDMTHAASQQFLHDEVQRMVRDWGFNYLKIDGLFTGLGARQHVSGGDYLASEDDDWGRGVLSDPTQTHVEAFRDGLTLIRDTAGPNVFLLGCNTAQNMRLYGASMGLVDAMRIGPDNDGVWNLWSGTSPVFGSRSYFLNGRVWYNDPDACYVRPGLTLDEARTSASWTSISGQLYTNSDWLPGLPQERIDIIKRTIAPHGQTARPVDFLENDPPRVWQVIDDKGPVRRDVVALFNWTDAPLTINVPLAKLDLPKAARYAAFDFWANQFLPDVTDAISQTLPPHACRIIALRAMEDHPVVLSTSAYVTQGMIDVIREWWIEMWWGAKLDTLVGESRVVGGEPYELRIATPNPAQKWKSFHVQYTDASTRPEDAITILNGVDKDHRASFVGQRDGVVSWSFNW